MLICSRGDLEVMAFVASLDVKTASDVARPVVVSKILTLTVRPRTPHSGITGTDARHSWVRCETEFPYSRCIRQGGVEAPVLWGRIAKYVFCLREVVSQKLGIILRRAARQ